MYQGLENSFRLMLLQDSIEVSALLEESYSEDYRPDPAEEKRGRVELNHAIHDGTAIAL